MTSSPITLAALALALLTLAPPALPAPSGATPPPFQAVPDAGAAVDAELAADAQQFEREYGRALGEWTRTIESLPAGGAAEPPPHPDVEFFPRMQELARRGFAEADRWLLEHLDTARLAPRERRELRGRLSLDVLERELALPIGERAELQDAAMHLARAAVDAERARAEDVAHRLLLESTRDDEKAAALFALGEVACQSGNARSPEEWLEADQLFARLLELYPNSIAATPAARRLTELMQRRFEHEVNAWWEQWTTAERPPDPSDHPAHRWWSRFEQLGDRGVGQALWWMVLNAHSTSISDDERRALRVRIMDELISDHANDEWLVAAIQEADRMVDEFSRDAVLELGARLLEASTNTEVRAWTLYELGGLEAQDEADPEGVTRAIAWYERLIREHPRHRLALAVGPELFALKHLRVGQVAPDVQIPQGDREPLQLADFRGRVLVVYFWASWSSLPGADLVQLEGLWSDKIESPLAILGVNVDDDIVAARARVVEDDLNFPMVYLGGAGAAWPHSWNVRDFPTTFVIDAAGVIRAKGVLGTELSEVVEELLAEDPPGPSPSGDPAGEGAPKHAGRRPLGSRHGIEGG